MKRGHPPPSPDGPEAPRSSTELLRQRTFGLWFLGNLANNSGTWLYNVAAAVVVFDLTRSALAVGLVSVAQYLPLVLLAPWVGALSDRFDRRRLLMLGQSFAAACATALAVVIAVTGADGLPGAWVVIVTSAGIGLGIAFATPAMQALVPALVEARDLDVAVALHSLTFNVGRALGPALAGAVLFTLGVEVAFAVNAASFVALLAALVAIRPRRRDARHTADRSVRAGLTYVWRDRTVLHLLVAVGMIGFAADPVTTLTPALAVTVGGDSRLVAFFVSAFGATAGLTAFATPSVYRRIPVATAGRFGCMVMIAGLLLAATAPTRALALAGFGLMGPGYLLGVNSCTGLLHRHVPDEFRGRVMALWAMAFLGSRPLAALVDGAAADLVGVRPAFGVAVAMAAAALLVISRLARPPTAA